MCSSMFDGVHGCFGSFITQNVLDLKQFRLVHPATDPSGGVNWCAASNFLSRTT